VAARQEDTTEFFQLSAHFDMVVLEFNGALRSQDPHFFMVRSTSEQDVQQGGSSLALVQEWAADARGAGSLWDRAIRDTLEFEEMACR
jgi:hypothetical protein